MTDEKPPIVVNVDAVGEELMDDGRHYAQAYKVLTPALSPRWGRLGVNQTRVPPGRTSCPFHTHALEDEVFFVLSGSGVLRYGDELHPIRAGDCISCPAGSGKAHQILNNSDADLVFLAIGMNDPDEVCTYPDSGKVMVRRLGGAGRFQKTPYMDGEPSPPVVFSLAGERD